MAVEPGDIIQVTCKFSMGTEDQQNVYYVRNGSTVDVPDSQFETDVTDWLDDAYAEIVSRIAAGVSFDTIEWRNLTQDGPTNYADWPTLTAGTGTGDALPAQCAPLVVFPTSVAKSQCRKYLPVGVEGDVSGGGDIVSGMLLDLAEYAVELLAGFYTGNGLGTMGAWNGTLERFAPIVSYAVDAIMRTQRRRVKGVGS